MPAMPVGKLNDLIHPQKSAKYVQGKNLSHELNHDSDAHRRIDDALQTQEAESRSKDSKHKQGHNRITGLLYSGNSRGPSVSYRPAPPWGLVP